MFGHDFNWLDIFSLEQSLWRTLECMYRKYVSNNALVYVSLLILTHIVYCRFVLNHKSSFQWAIRVWALYRNKWKSAENIILTNERRAVYL